LIDAAGNVGITGKKTLYINFGSEARAREFLERRFAQGFRNDVIKTFKVPSTYVDRLRNTAVPEALAGVRRDAPIAVDLSKAPDQFGLQTRSQIDDLLDNIIPGSGGVL
jgi:hypothetical protein